MDTWDMWHRPARNLPLDSHRLSRNLPYWFWDGYINRATPGELFRAVLGFRGQSKE